MTVSKIEKIHWKDHAGNAEARWEPASFVKEQGYLTEVVSVGITIQEDDDCVTLAHTLSKEQQVCGYSIIGKKLITKREILEPVKRKR